MVIQPHLKKSREHRELLLNEAISLVKAIDLKCVFSGIAGIDKVNPKTYLNSGYVFFKK